VKRAARAWTSWPTKKPEQAGLIRASFFGPKSFRTYFSSPSPPIFWALGRPILTTLILRCVFKHTNSFYVLSSSTHSTRYPEPNKRVTLIFAFPVGTLLIDVNFFQKLCSSPISSCFCDCLLSRLPLFIVDVDFSDQCPPHSD